MCVCVCVCVCVEASKKMLQYLAQCSGHRGEVDRVKNRLLQSNPVLEVREGRRHIPAYGESYMYIRHIQSPLPNAIGYSPWCVWLWVVGEAIAFGLATVPECLHVFLFTLLLGLW